MGGPETGLEAVCGTTAPDLASSVTWVCVSSSGSLSCTVKWVVVVEERPVVELAPYRAARVGPILRGGRRGKLAHYDS